MKRTESRLAVRYLDDTILLSDSHAWTYVRLPGDGIEFRDEVALEDLAGRISVAFSSLLTGGSATVDCHLVITSRPYNIGYWADTLNARVGRQQFKPAWNGYVHGMAEHLGRSAFLAKEVFLGVNLGQRTKLDLKNFDMLGPVRTLFTRGERALLLDDHEISDSEIAEWRVKAEEVRRVLSSGHLRARPADATTTAWLISKPLWPGTNAPNPTSVPRGVWGRGELEALAESVVVNNHKHLEITQTDPRTGRDVTGYVASLAVSRFPDVLLFPEQAPWIHHSQTLPFPVDWSVRFTIIPHVKAQKDVSRTLAAAQDQAAHMAEGGMNVPMAIREQLQTAEMLQYSLKKQQNPWLYARYRLRVFAATVDDLRGRAKQTIDHYRDLGIDVTWPSGDQFDMLLEAMPGEKVRTHAYMQRQELDVLAGGMPTATAEVGDTVNDDGQGWHGPYIGEVTSGMRLPVFYSPHVAIAQNRSPGVAILGKPGSGKSFLAFTVAYQCAAQGVWTIYIDPKADAKPIGNLPGLGASKVFDLRDGHDGMLDPFSLGDDVNQSKLLALDTLRLLLGGQNLSEERESALITAIEAVGATPNPSLWAVVEWLLAQQNLAARNLGQVLSTLRELPFARLCFAPTLGARLRPEDGLTIITLLGLDLPLAIDDPSQYTYENRLAVSVMYLLTRYARRLMLSLNKDYPKAIFIDEAWMVTGTKEGAKLIPETIRMGRAHNIGVVLVSQNARDLMDERIANSIDTVFAFRSDADAEIESVLSLLHVPADTAGFSAIRNLYRGECIMRDAHDRVSRLRVDPWEPVLWETFNTNPETRGKGLAENGPAQNPPVAPVHAAFGGGL
jgi:hypothetical protein